MSEKVPEADTPLIARLLVHERRPTLPKVLDCARKTPVPDPSGAA